jgi:hypothetical protein
VNVADGLLRTFTMEATEAVRESPFENSAGRTENVGAAHDSFLQVIHATATLHFFHVNTIHLPLL